jgi:dihydroxyacid dehydratase/phosphogluconate dehydratase
MDFGKIVKKAVERQNMLAWQYNTIGVSDAITMGGEGKFHTSTLSQNFTRFDSQP